MNHIYRTVWNKALGAMVAVAEIAPSGGRSTGTRTAARKRATSLAALGLPPDATRLALLSLGVALAWGASVATAHAQTLPQGGTAIHGSAALNYSQPNKLTVTTTNGAGTGHSAINWNSFNIGTGATTNFVQPSAASMSINRVVTISPSQLFGTLSSNGKIVLVNQSGIAVGAGALVDTAGFTASAVGMSAQDAIAGRLRFAGSELGNHTGALKVEGNVIARGGDVVLIAPSIDLAKTAVVESHGGSVALAAGQSVEITGRGLEGITLHVQAPSDQAINLGSLKGDAVGIFAGTLRHSGLIQAVSADLVGGKVVLRATGDAYVSGQGQILATGAADGAKGGSVDVFGQRVALEDQALIDVSGQAGGGNIRVGGDFQGKNPDVPNAQRTNVWKNTTLKADAITTGEGGRVIVWADDQTGAYGTISARGGAHSGDGGFVEVSGKHRLAFDATVNTLAPKGKSGTLLLDPDFIDVAIGGVAALNTVDQFADFGASVVISPATINAAATNVVLQANEDINFIDPISMTNPGVGITAQAGGFLNVGASITTKGGAVSLRAGDPGSLTNPSEGSLTIGAAIDTTGGGAFPTGANITLRSDISDVGGNSLQLTAGVINAGASTLTILSPTASIEQFVGSSIVAANLSVLADYTIDLNQPGNSITGNADFSSNLATGSGTLFAFRNSASSFNLSGAVSRGNLGFTITTAGSMSTDGPMQSNGNMTITAPGGLTIADDITVAGTLNLNTSGLNGLIQQNNGSIQVGGVTSINAGTNDINMFSSPNDFNGINLTGRSVGINDINALNVLSLSNPGAINLNLAAGGQLTLPATPLTASFQLSLDSGGTLATNGAITGAQVDISGATGVTLAHNITATTSLNVASSGGGVNQPSGIVNSSGATTVTAAGIVNLPGATNDFNTLAVSAGGTVNVNDSGAAGIAHQNITGTSVAIIAQGGIFRNAGTITSTSGNIALQGANIGDDSNPIASYVALAPAAGVTLNALSGGVYVQQTAGNLNMGNYTVSVPTAGQHIKIASSASNTNLNAAFTNFNGNTDDDMIDVIAWGTNNSININALGNTTKTAVLMNFRAEGAGSNVFVLAGDADLVAPSGVVVESWQGNINVGSKLANASGPLALRAGGSITGGGDVVASGSALEIVANSQAAGFVSTGAGGIAVTGNITTSGINGVNSVDPLVARGKDAGDIDIKVDGISTGTISLGTVNAIGGTGAALLSTGVGQPGGNGGSVFIEKIDGNLAMAGTVIVTDAGFGGAALAFGAAGGAGGNAGSVFVATSNGNLNFQGNIYARGGNGGNAQLSGVTALGGTPGLAGQIHFDVVGDLQFTGVTTLDNAAAAPGTDNTGAGGFSSAQQPIFLTADNILQAVGSTVDAAGKIVRFATTGGVQLGEVSNQFGEMDGVAGSDITIRGLYGVGDFGISTSSSLSLTGLLSQPLYIQGALNANDISLTGDSIVIKDHITSAISLNLNGLNGISQDQLGGGSTIQVGNLTTINAGATNVDFGGANINNNFNGVEIVSAGAVNIRDGNGLILSNVSATSLSVQTSSGAVSQFGSTAINVGALTLDTGTGNVSLTEANNVGTLTISNAGSAQFKNGGSFTLASANTSAFLEVESTSGGLTVGGPVSAGGHVVLNALGGQLVALNRTIGSGGQINLAASNGINITGSVFNAATDLNISTQGGPLNAAGVTHTLGGNWRTFLTDYAGGGHTFGPFDPLVNADFRQVDGNFGNILGTGNGSLWTDSGTISGGTLTGLATKTYDGLLGISLNGVGISGLVFNEPVVNLAGQAGALADPNAGVGKLVTLTGPLSLDGLVTDANGKPTYGYTVASASGNVGTVNPALVTVASLNGTREYDGTTIVNANIFNINGLINNETLTLAGAGTIADKNVGANKVVNIGLVGQGGLALGNGTGLASNYTLAGGTHLATITRRTQSNWLGGSGLWSSPTSWDVMPDAANVAGVSIPAGVQVTYDAAAGTTQLDRINSAGGVIMAGGNLQIADEFRTLQYGQTGGLLDGSGRLIVESLFGKNGGLINMGGLVDITQASGNLVVGGMRGANILLKADNGGITQNGALATPGVLAAQAPQDIVLDNPNNNVNGFAAFTSNGDVDLVNNGVLNIVGIGTQNGNIRVVNTGKIETTGPVRAPNGRVFMQAKSPLVIGPDGIVALGDIILLAGNADGDMLINGDLISTDGGIDLVAGGNIQQNSLFSAAQAINVFAAGIVNYGPLAISSGNPVRYFSGGLSVTPPPSSLAELLARNNGVGGFISDFLDRFEDALDNRATKDDDPKNKKDKGELVVEGETCRP